MWVWGGWWWWWGPFQRGYRYNRRVVNSAVGEEMVGDNVNYYDANWGNSGYLRDHRLIQVNFKGNDIDCAPREILFADIDGGMPISKSGFIWEIAARPMNIAIRIERKIPMRLKCLRKQIRAECTKV